MPQFCFGIFAQIFFSYLYPSARELPSLDQTPLGHILLSHSDSHVPDTKDLQAAVGTKGEMKGGWLVGRKEGISVAIGLHALFVFS